MVLGLAVAGVKGDAAGFLFEKPTILRYLKPLTLHALLTQLVIPGSISLNLRVLRSLFKLRIPWHLRFAVAEKGLQHAAISQSILLNRRQILIALKARVLGAVRNRECVIVGVGIVLQVGSVLESWVVVC